MHSISTPSGRKINSEQFASAACAVEQIATNNSQMLRVKLSTSDDDVMALVELARQKFYELSRQSK